MLHFLLHFFLGVLLVSFRQWLAAQAEQITRNQNAVCVINFAVTVSNTFGRLCRNIVWEIGSTMRGAA